MERSLPVVVVSALTLACGSTAHDRAPAAGATSTATAGSSASGGAPTTGGESGSGGGLPSVSGASSGGVSTSGGAGGFGTAGAAVVDESSGPITVRLDQAKQKMDGFGISITFAAEQLTDAELDALFDAERGLGLSILRIGMAAHGGPMTSSTFPDAKRAVERGVTTIMASIPTAPAACKTNGDEDDGGHLISDDGGACYESWASKIAAFPAQVKSEVGVDLYALSIGNEPDFASCGMDKPCNGSYPSMLYSAEEAVAFTKVVGPKLHAASPSTKLMPPETRQWQRLWKNDSAKGGTDPLAGRYDYGHALSGDAQAWAQIDLLGVHQYDTQLAEPWPSDVPRTKAIWQTEMSGAKHWPEEGPSIDIDNGLAVAGWIHDAVVNGPASAWLWFWYKAPFTDDNEGLLLRDGTDTKRRYTLGNFSRFVRPGYTRVGVTGAPVTDVLLSAYTGSDGAVVVVAINRGSAPISVPIAVTGGSAPASLVPWQTSATSNLIAKAAVPVTGGSFTALLDGKSVTTFVGK